MKRSDSTLRKKTLHLGTVQKEDWDTITHVFCPRGATLLVGKSWTKQATSKKTRHFLVNVHHPDCGETNESILSSIEEFRDTAIFCQGCIDNLPAEMDRLRALEALSGEAE